MAKKSDSFYFGNFYACADCAYQAAHLLERVMRDFDPLLIREKLDDMHNDSTSHSYRCHRRGGTLQCLLFPDDSLCGHASG